MWSWKFGWCFGFSFLFAFKWIRTLFWSSNGLTVRVLNGVWRRKILLMRKMNRVQIRIWLGMIRLWKRLIILRRILGLGNTAYLSIHSWIVLISVFYRAFIKIRIPSLSSVPINLWGRWWYPHLLIMITFLIRMDHLFLEFLLYFLFRLFLFLTRLKSWLWLLSFSSFLFLFLTIVLLKLYQNLKSLLYFFYLRHDLYFNLLRLFEHIINFLL